MHVNKNELNIYNMLSYKNNLLLSIFLIMLSTACSSSKKHSNLTNGWVVKKTVQKTGDGYGFLILTMHDTEDSTNRFPVSRYVINGVDLPTQDITKKIHVFPGKYKIKASGLGLTPIEVLINKKPDCDVLIDFYMKYADKY